MFHFVREANLTYKQGVISALAQGYMKEDIDALEIVVGRDSGGWDPDDIAADIVGVAWDLKLKYRQD